MRSRRLMMVMSVRLRNRSHGSAAEIDSHSDWSFLIARGRSPRSSPSHASDAQRAPPEVPLNATTSTSVGRLPKSPSSTPAVKAVWLPPPWQAIATRLRGAFPIFVVSLDGRSGPVGEPPGRFRPEGSVRLASDHEADVSSFDGHQFDV